MAFRGRVGSAVGFIAKLLACLYVVRFSCVGKPILDSFTALRTGVSSTVSQYRVPGGGGAGLPLIREWKLQRTLPSLVGQYKLPRKRLSLFCFSLKEDLSQTGTSPYSGVRVGGGWAGGVSDRSGGKS